ncbi:MAG: class I SAM-dependent methyltransferase [Pseudomonadota bacterium]
MSTPAPRDIRRQKEADFHDQWAADVQVSETLVDETFTSVTALENQHILEQFGDVRGLTVLDYGCGAAEGGIYLAKLGAKVVAIDVSPGMLELAQKLAKHHGVEIETRIVNSDRIPAADNEFDRIYGNGVLHHVPVDSAMPELARILKPDGKACFIEPIPYNPLINAYRKIAASVRTEDEHPISFRQIEGFARDFGSVTHREFWLTALAVFLKFYLWDRVNPNKERYWKKIYTDANELRGFFSPLKAIDERILKAFPGLGRMCWNSVITVSKPIKRGARAA